MIELMGHHLVRSPPRLQQEAGGSPLPGWEDACELCFGT